MRFGFVSLMSGQPWGGSEVLWSKTAHLAINNGHKVFISVYDWGKLHPEIKKLKDLGAIVQLRKRYNNENNLFNKVVNHFKNRVPWLDDSYTPIIKFKPDHLLISQGECFDISMHHYNLYNIINQNKISYSLVCNSHVQYSDIPHENIYPRAKVIFQGAKNIFFVSNRMKAMAERKLCTKIHNSIITWNPLNLLKINYIPWPNNSIIQFAIVGDIISGKGHDTLLECLSTDLWKIRNWHLNIYGKGYGENYLKDLAEFYGLTNRITLHGFVMDINEIWTKNNILLIPSSGEGLPISLIEAMICGRPAVVTEVGGNIEVITEDHTGYIAEAPSVLSFSKALGKAWINKDNWEQMGKNAYEYCIKNIDLNPEIKIINYILKT